MASDKRSLDLTLLLRGQPEKQLLSLLLTHRLRRIARRLRIVSSERLLMMLRRVEDGQLGDGRLRQCRRLRSRACGGRTRGLGWCGYSG